MPTWNFSIETLLFPIAVTAVWSAIFLLMLYLSRFAAHEHDSEAQAESQREESAQAQAASGATATMTPQPS
jgi:Na+/melibiose symporter-like transporter